MGLRGFLAVLLVLSVPARGQGVGSLGQRGGGSTTPPTVASEEVVAALAEELQHAAGKEWALHRDRDTFTLAMEIQVLPMGAFSRDSRETRTYRIVVALGPYLTAAAQRAALDAGTKKERTLWGTVARLECSEKQFDDHYEDGLCFRAKTDAEQRRVAAYRQARSQLAAVPRFHRAAAFAVSVRQEEPQLTSGACVACRAAADKLRALFTPY